jgi:hypothetical protein
MLDELIEKAAKKYDVPKGLMERVILEERLQRYRRRGDKRHLVDSILELIQEEIV